MPHLIKQSNKRLIISGGILEYIQYEKPFFYNFPPLPKKHFHYEEKEKKIVRRDDNIIVSRNNLKRLITANLKQNKELPIFLTFTFAENVDNPDIANPLWSLFVKRFNYFLATKYGFPKAKFVCVIEFQKRGAVHYHAIYFNLPYIPNIKIELAQIWRYGFIKVISLARVNFIGLYVSKYLQKGLIDERLRNKKAYFSSRGLLRPRVFRNQSLVEEVMSNHSEELLSEQVFETQKYGFIMYKMLRYIPS